MYMFSYCKCLEALCTNLPCLYIARTIYIIVLASTVNTYTAIYSIHLQDVSSVCSDVCISICLTLYMRSVQINSLHIYTKDLHQQARGARGHWYSCRVAFIQLGVVVLPTCWGRYVLADVSLSCGHCPLSWVGRYRDGHFSEVPYVLVPWGTHLRASLSDDCLLFRESVFNAVIPG